MSGPLWAHIPAELRERQQWLVAGPSKAPLGIAANGTTYNGSVSDPLTWCSFDVAAQYAYTHGLQIGYVISENDPFCCIDLDWTDEDSQKRKGKPIDPTKWSTQQDANRYNLIMQAFQSYTERSVNKKGLHIWVRADIGDGRRRDGIEVYSQARFIVCTGDRLSGLSPLIEDRQGLVEKMIGDMMHGVESRSALEPLVELPEDPEDVDCNDAYILAKAVNAENRDKFNKLFAGEWEEKEYPSQSEADLALMSMFTFYSDNNIQCRRLFRSSELGKREKAIKNDRYLNYTLRLIRHRQKYEETNPKDKQNGQEAKLLHKAQKAEQAEHVPLGSEQYTTQPGPMPAAVALATLTLPSPPTNGEFGYPPGVAGAIAKFIFESAPRPVKEVAIVSAIGLLAGICGKAWHIPQSGLNMYVILIARSGVGKEAMHSGISAILKASRSPHLGTFVQFNNFVSGPALTKFCASNASFVNVSGEWGQRLKRMAEGSNDSAMATLRTVMTDLYQKSGPQAIVGGMNYSNKDNNVESVSGVAFSMIGETTPATFYETLTESMMADGFLSRFTIVEYEGDRPDTNPAQNLNPPQHLVDHLTGLASLAVQINGQGGVLSTRESVLVQRTPEAAAIIKAFDVECDKQIRGSKDESWRQMWNRASLKAQRLGALMGAADNPSFPCIEVHHIEWAIDLIRRDIAVMRKKIEQGDVGMGDHSRRRKLVAILREYMDGAPAPGYKVNEKMHSDNVVPTSYLQIRTASLAVFSKNRMGASAALAQAIREFTDAGWLKEIEKAKAMIDYNYRGKCYMIVDLPIHNTAKE